MRKFEELANGASCLNRANHDELIFVLLGRDVAAPAAIRAWARERIACGKNAAGDDQILEALICAVAMSGRVADARPVAPGYLEVGHTEDTHEVVLNHPDLDVDPNGCGHIVFSPKQARDLAVLLIHHAHVAEAEAQG